MCAGIGVHTGAHVRVVLRPAPIDTGLVFLRTDVPGAAPVRAEARHVAHTELGTTLRGADGVEIATVEHLVAACRGLGLDNLFIDVDGPELPILDGSAAPFVQVLKNAGLRAQGAPRRVLRILRTVEVAAGDKRAALSPIVGDGFEMDVTIRFKDPAIGVQRRRLSLTPEAFLADIAEARTFGFMAELSFLHERGRGRGASLDNVVVIDQGAVVNPEGLRFHDEFVRHKMLDAIGDLALVGGAIAGRFTADQPGHALNARLVEALIANPDAWRWETPAEDAATSRLALASA